VKAKRRSSKSTSSPADLSPEDESLLEALRAWRLKAARGKPAYTVANNRTLEGIAAVRPRAMTRLAEIHGVGPAFLKRHGDDVLELIAAQS
jgi:ATP-dependent DNA helicase RecQ